MPQDVEDILEYERRKHERRDDLIQSVSYAFGSIIFVITLAAVLALIFWLLSPRARAVEPEPHIVELAEFKDALDHVEQPVIFDMRTDREYAAGHLPGAVTVENDKCHVYGIDICTRRNSCESFSPAFFYSVKGEEYHEVRSALSVTKTSCWTDVYLLDGGYRAWQAAGYEIEL